MPRTRSSSSKRRPRARATCGARHAAHSSVYHYIHYTPSDTRRGLCIGLKLHRVTATLARPSAKPCHICTRTGLAPRQASSLRRSISAHKQPAHIGASPGVKRALPISTVQYGHRIARTNGGSPIVLGCCALHRFAVTNVPFQSNWGRVYEQQRQLIRRSVFAAQASASRSATCTRTRTRPTAGITRTFCPQSRCWSSQSSTANPARWAYHA